MLDSEKITVAIGGMLYDIKAEAVIGDLMAGGMGIEDFVVIPNGTFRRRYARDIAFAKKKKHKNGQEFVEININRDAIYHTLPEGIFHEKTKSGEEGANSHSDESKKLKKEEKAARTFFLPFENEIFLQRVKLEQEERKILKQFSENLFDDISPEFWNLDKSINREYMSRMIVLLHFSHQIVGNCKITAKCLESILNESVSVKIGEDISSGQWESGKKRGVEHGCVLGSAGLGTDFVCGDNLKGFTKKMKFSIGPLKNTNVIEYLENGTVYNFLKCFFGYFVPFELDVETDILVEQDNQEFLLGFGENVAVLGYKSAI
jgi:hypothetical protein